jgi:hypothetical protein
VLLRCCGWCLPFVCCSQLCCPVCMLVPPCRPAGVGGDERASVCAPCLHGRCHTAPSSGRITATVTDVWWCACLPACLSVRRVAGCTTPAVCGVVTCERVRAPLTSPALHQASRACTRACLGALLVASNVCLKQAAAAKSEGAGSAWLHCWPTPYVPHKRASA